MPRLDMRILVVALLLSAATLAPLATATADLPVCYGYKDCSERAGDGFAVFCVKNPKNNGQWYCAECESCGNGPQLRTDDLPVLP